MNAPLQLPLGNGAGAPIQPSTCAVAEGEAWNQSPQYHRLFGTLTPAQVMLSVAPNPLPAHATYGSPSALSDPTQAASYPFYSLLADAGHPSAASLASIAQLRTRHLAMGHHPATDAARGPLFWMRGIREWWEKAMSARSADKRRKALVAATALLVAMIDAEDFHARKDTPDEG